MLIYSLEILFKIIQIFFGWSFSNIFSQSPVCFLCFFTKSEIWKEYNIIRPMLEYPTDDLDVWAKTDGGKENS